MVGALAPFGHSLRGPAFWLSLVAGLGTLDVAPLFGTPPAALAQDAQLRLSVDAEKVELGGEFSLTVEANGRHDELALPSLDAFDVVGQRITQVNRRMSRAYTLRPKKAGTFTLEGGALLLGGRVVATAAPVTVTVVEPAAAAPVEAAVAQDLSAREGEGAFVRWAAARERYVVGEPFVMTLELWLAAGLEVRQAELVKAAKFAGLLTEDLPRDPDQQPARRAIGKTAFEVHRLSQVVATPMKPGRVLVDGTTVRLSVAEQGFGFGARVVNRTSQPFWVDVEALPEEGRPDGMPAGHVGKFELKVSLRDDRRADPGEVRTGARLVLRAEVAGQGALAGLEAPEVSHDGSWEVALLPGTSEDVVTRSERGVEGLRVFQWLVTPKQPGSRSVPRVALAWYDTVARRFVRERSPERTVQVVGEAAPQQALAATALGEDVGPLVTPAQLARTGLPPLPSTILYWAVLGLGLLAFLGFEVRHALSQRDAADPGVRESRRALGGARERLSALGRQPQADPRQGFLDLSRALTAYLTARAGIPAAGLTQEALGQALGRAGYPAELAAEVTRELGLLELGGFSPESVTGGLPGALARVDGLLGRLDAHAPRRSA
jgi:hypothetical protein